MRKSSDKKPFALLCAAALLTLSTLFGGTAGAQKARPKKAPSVKVKNSIVEMPGIEPLKEAFQRDRGKVRLVTILSPT